MFERAEGSDTRVFIVDKEFLLNKFDTSSENTFLLLFAMMSKPYQRHLWFLLDYITHYHPRVVSWWRQTLTKLSFSTCPNPHWTQYMVSMCQEQHSIMNFAVIFLKMLIQFFTHNFIYPFLKTFRSFRSYNVGKFSEILIWWTQKTACKSVKIWALQSM